MYNYANLDPGKCDFIAIGDITDIANGERLFVEIDDLSIIVFNIAGEFFAIEDKCSHDNASFDDGELAERTIKCPRHGALFDIRSGKALSLPAVVDIPAYPVRINGGEIEVGLPQSV
ncbi:MAG: non-heme iron oxygenase ferredoxin subunit [Anaerolineales bacterium]|nr:non-heme iron oxygenase ferredoxin subunit [Anaerolineales bacterium]